MIPLGFKFSVAKATLEKAGHGHRISAMRSYQKVRLLHYDVIAALFRYMDKCQHVEKPIFRNYGTFWPC